MNRALKLIEALLKVTHNPDDRIMTGFGSNRKEVHDDNPSVENSHNTLSKEAKSNLFDGKDQHTRRTAIESYTAGSYEGMNQHLRHGQYVDSEDPKLNGKKVSPLVIKHIEPLKELTNNKTQHTFDVYRGSRTKLVDETKGSMFQDKGFTSTSLRPNIGKEFHNDVHGNPAQGGQKFRIRIRPGTKGHYVGAHPESFGHEREFILHPGTKFKVGKSFKHPNGNTYTNLHIHSQED